MLRFALSSVRLIQVLYPFLFYPYLISPPNFWERIPINLNLAPVFLSFTLMDELFIYFFCIGHCLLVHWRWQTRFRGSVRGHIFSPSTGGSQAEHFQARSVGPSAAVGSRRPPCRRVFCGRQLQVHGGVGGESNGEIKNIL